MPGKNIVFIACSLDGYIAGKHGELDWLHAIPNPDNVDMGFQGLMDEIDALVMGRTTFETVCGFGGEWPYPKPVFVLSNSLVSIPEPYREKAQLLKGEPHDILDTLHRQGLQNLYIDGGTTIRHFLKQDLIDELRITTIPILLGGGAPLFGDLDAPLAFEQVKTRVFLDQLVQVWYRRKRAPHVV